VVLLAAHSRCAGAMALLLLTGTAAQRLVVHGADLIGRSDLKNGIILLDFTRHRDADWREFRSIAPSSKRVAFRLRRSSMTTLCTLFGLFAARVGPWSRKRAPEATRRSPVIGGLTFDANHFVRGSDAARRPFGGKLQAPGKFH